MPGIYCFSCGAGAVEKFHLKSRGAGIRPILEDNAPAGSGGRRAQPRPIHRRTTDQTAAEGTPQRYPHHAPHTGGTIGMPSISWDDMDARGTTPLSAAIGSLCRTARSVLAGPGSAGWSVHATTAVGAPRHRPAPRRPAAEAR